MKGTDGETYTQGYLGISNVKVDDLSLSFTVDNSHIVFD
jgi:hypothetical protein